MKKTNTLFALTLAFTVVLISSCFDSGNSGNTYDGSEYVRVSGSFPFYNVVGDSGTNYTLVNPEKMDIKTNEGVYQYERAALWFKYDETPSKKLAEGLPVNRRVKVININPVPVNNFNFSSDTLKVDQIDYASFIQVAKPWGDQYFINIPFRTPSSPDNTTNNYTLFVENSSKNTLNLRLLDIRLEKDVAMGQPINAFISFKLDRDYLKATNSDLDFSDSIKVNISAKERQDGIKKLDSFKIKFN